VLEVFFGAMKEEVIMEVKGSGVVIEMWVVWCGIVLSFNGMGGVEFK